MKSPRKGRIAAASGLLLGLWLAVGSGRGQEPPSPYNPQLPPAESTATPDKGEGPKRSGELQQTTDGKEKKDGDKKQPESPWAKVPPVKPMPRLGYFLVPPSGPGYYSFLDVLQGNYRQNPPNFPYPPFAIMANSFFDADFRYLDKSDNKQHDFFDCLKRIHPTCDWMFTTGGEFRLRYNNEVNARLTGNNNQYDLLRTRVYGDLWYRDEFRLYVEYIDAQSLFQDLAPLPIDVNHSDFLNAFVDVKLTEYEGKPVYVRGGRQELLYGSQRLISPLDWVNTRRTFQGVKVFRQGEKWDVDAFWVQPVTISPGHLDSVDDKLNFTGLWTTYRPRAGHFIDLYYLNLDRSGPADLLQYQVPGAFNTVAPGHFNISTLGSRYAGDYQKRLLWDFEGMLQFGTYLNQNDFAAAYTTGMGYRFADLPATPQLWVYYDYASGDNNPGQGNSRGTFNQLFSFGHYYFGFLDLVGRQNIEDFNMQLSFYPAKWVTVATQYHRFRLAEERDALYTAGGVPIRRDPSGLAGTDVGREIDFITNFHLSPHQDLLVGYSKLFAGDFLKRTGNPDSPEFFYLQYNYRW